MHGNSPICPSHCVAICNSALNHSQALIAFDETNEAQRIPLSFATWILKAHRKTTREPLP